MTCLLGIVPARPGHEDVFGHRIDDDGIPVVLKFAGRCRSGGSPDHVSVLVYFMVTMSLFRNRP